MLSSEAPGGLKVRWQQKPLLRAVQEGVTCDVHTLGGRESLKGLSSVQVPQSWVQGPGFPCPVTLERPWMGIKVKTLGQGTLSPT